MIHDPNPDLTRRACQHAAAAGMKRSNLLTAIVHVDGGDPSEWPALVFMAPGGTVRTFRPSGEVPSHGI